MFVGFFVCFCVSEAVRGKGDVLGTNHLTPQGARDVSCPPLPSLINFKGLCSWLYESPCKPDVLV